MTLRQGQCPCLGASRAGGGLGGDALRLQLGAVGLRLGPRLGAGGLALRLCFELGLARRGLVIARVVCGAVVGAGSRAAVIVVDVVVHAVVVARRRAAVVVADVVVRAVVGAPTARRAALVVAGVMAGGVVGAVLQRDEDRATRGGGVMGHRGRRNRKQAAPL